MCETGDPPFRRDDQIMKFFTTLTLAFRALLRNPTRSLLTTLGIVIGISAVIAMTEIGKGSSNSISNSISQMGAGNLLIFPSHTNKGGISSGSGSAVTLTPGDYEAIVRECYSVGAAAPVVTARAQVVAGNKNWNPWNIHGSTPEYVKVQNFGIPTEGTLFTDKDVQTANAVCLIGNTVRRELFGEGLSPIGEEIRIGKVNFRVVGVLPSKGANMMGFDQDDIILAPWTTIRYRVTGNRTSTTSSAGNNDISTGDLYPSTGAEFYPERSETQVTDTLLAPRFTSVDQIMVQAVSPDSVNDAMEEITLLLRERHKIPAGAESDFQVRSFSEMANTLQTTSTVMTNLLLCIAMISLLVGGVGIMNIMLVSVTERTREIGLRMAVGARSRDILRQFLVEATVLCLFGGIIGIILGRAGAYMVSSIMRWPTESSPGAVIAAVVTSAAVGIIFGFYPAWKASRLDPIDALRYE